ncbi:metal-dependent hydrolase [Amorphus coralli]|uniref:metal-dependent hydrolase n=1 Tax=Amorphus coralli TaxID=340680 RepID=UPI00037C6336|nr:metal-dependent hydrolase [Amorphus coralli]
MQITWLGHSAFRIEMGEAVVLIDPFLTGNSVFTGTVEAARERVTHIVLTHGHDDHLGDTPEIAKATGAQVVANFELCMWLQEVHGIENINPGNTGGTVDAGPFKITFVRADHSSGVRRDGQSVYFGNPLGVILTAEGQPTLYHMGDTDIFSDMALINELYQPEIGIVPIGDRFTMGARTAALACTRFFSFKTIIPCHYKTFPIIDQSADAFLQEMGSGAKVVRVPEPMVPFEA